MVGEKEGTEFRLLSSGQPQQMMDREDIVRVVACPRHQQHSLRVCVMFKIAAELLLGNCPGNSQCQDCPTCTLVPKRRAHFVILDLLLKIKMVQRFSDGMPPLDVRDLVRKYCCPEPAIRAD